MDKLREMSENTVVQASSSRAASSTTEPPKKFPKGVVLGKDGKPCRSCTSFASWASMTKAQTSNPSKTQTVPAVQPSDCPPDVDELGRSSWTLLHGMAATYPPSAPPTMQSKTKQFLSLFSELYPCWVCADDFRDWMKEPGNEPKLEGQDVFGFWMCRAHNAVNEKLGKPEFDCALWKERWKDGWKDGRCG